jgi:hypothetical protein
MRKIAVLLAALAAMLVVAAGASAHNREFEGNAYCKAGVDITSTNFLQDLLLQQAADHGGYWALPNGIPFIDQTPNDWQVDHFNLVFVTVTEGTCPTAPSSGPPPKPVGIFLCYSTFQTDPGVWPAPEAAELLTEGYWLPYAVPGNVTGGTNMGDFHLICNLASSQSVGDSFIGQDGTVFGPAYTGVSGLYPKVG